MSVIFQNTKQIMHFSHASFCSICSFSALFLQGLILLWWQTTAPLTGLAYVLQRLQRFRAAMAVAVAQPPIPLIGGELQERTLALTVRRFSTSVTLYHPQLPFVLAKLSNWTTALHSTSLLHCTLF